MPSYAPQDVLETIVVASIATHGATGRPLHEVCTEFCRTYLQHYPNDQELPGDVAKAAEALHLALFIQAGEERLLPVTRQLMYCLQHFEANGRKKRKKLFGGTWFNREKSYDPDRVDTATRNLMAYHLGSLDGGFPLAPTDWRF